MTTASFEFRFHPVFRAAALALGVRPETSGVEVSDHELVVRFGPWKVRTPITNVLGAHVTGPYSWPKVLGPPHVSFADRGLTFATNPDEGVCVGLNRPVRGLDPWGVVRHPGLTLTVREPAALAELLDLDRHRPERVHIDVARPMLDDLVEAVHDDLHSLTAAELRRRAGEQGVTGVSRRSKAELVQLLEPDLDASEPS